MKHTFKLLILLTIISSCSAKIIWLKEANYRMNWYEAVKYCKKQDAHLPSKINFQNIWYENNKSSNIEGFDLSISYWTSDETKNKKNAAYPFYFMEGRDTWYYKADKYGVRCIINK